MKKIYEILQKLTSALIFFNMIIASYYIYLAINTECKEGNLCSYDYIYISEYILFVTATSCSFFKALIEVIFRRKEKMYSKSAYISLILLFTIAIATPVLLIVYVDSLDPYDYLIRGCILVISSIIISKDFIMSRNKITASI